MIYAAALRVSLLDREFARDFEGCGSFFGLLARNYQLFPARDTLLLPVQSSSRLTEHPTPYFNHPPLVPLFIALTHTLFGYDASSGEPAPPWHLRLSPSLFTLGSVMLIFTLLRRQPFRAVVASALFAATPMTVLYGGMPDVVGPQLVFFTLLSVLAYMKLLERPTVSRASALAFSFTLAALTDWPAFYLVPIIGVHAALSRDRRLIAFLLAFSGCSVALFALLYTQAAMVAQDWGWMLQAFSRRALSSQSDASTAITFSGWIETALLGHAGSRLTLPILLTTGLWIVIALTRPRRTFKTDPATATLTLFSLVHISIGRQGLYQHDWWWWPLVPASAMATSACILWLANHVSSRVSAISVVAALIALTTWTTIGGLRELARPKSIVDSPLNYSVVELGALIRQSTPVSHRAILVESDQSIALWFYACRDVQMNVWSPQQFEQALASSRVDLLFGATELSRSVPATAIVPKAYAEFVPELVSHLTQRYSHRETPKFILFDLRKPRRD
jgi:hypothetical protein